jgi:hypothetical protein
MGKKQVAVSLRKPPPADPDAFVAGAEKTERPAPVAPRVAEGPSVATRAGERRELTIYLQPELARKLSVRCLELDRDVSNVVSEAIATSLEGPEPVTVEPSPIEALASRARTLLGELRSRVEWALPFA